MVRPITVIDLFTGSGGLTRGWHDAIESAGTKTRTVASVELDPVAAHTYRLNFGSAGQFVGGIEEWLDSTETPHADVILGGPPCQGFSLLGKRDINDPRNVLWRAYAETIVRARPKYFVVENVRPFLKSTEYAAFEAETRPGGRLDEYSLMSMVLSAADFGAFQNRERAVVIGSRKDMPMVVHPQPFLGRSAWRTVRQAFANIPNETNGVELPKKAVASGKPGPFRTFELHLSRDYSDTTLARFRSIPPGGNRFDLPEDLQFNCWRKRPTGLTDVMGRMYWDRPSVTIRTEFFKPEKGRYLHPTEDRAISHWEAARLQGFPDDFWWVGSKVDIAKQIGNAVPVQLGKAISAPIIDGLADAPADDLRRTAAAAVGGETTAAA